MKGGLGITVTVHKTCYARPRPHQVQAPADKFDILRQAHAVYIDEIRKAGLYDDIWQAFAVLLPVKTVGVMGDGRTYGFVVGLRPVTSTDGMIADFTSST